MTDYLYYASLGMIVFLFVLSTVIYKKLRIWKLILVILMMAIFVIVEFFSSLVTFISENDLQSYFSYLVYLIVIVLAIFFRNKIKVTQNLTDYDFFELEKELESIRDSSDLLRKRFIHTIGLLNEGLVFYDDDLSGLFLSDEITDILEIDNPQLTIEEFKKSYSSRRPKRLYAVNKEGRKKTSRLASQVSYKSWKSLYMGRRKR